MKRNNQEMKNSGHNYMPNKEKITRQQVDELYDIDEGITEDTETNPLPEPEMSVKQDTTPEYLTEEEEEHDKNLEESLNWDDEI